MKWGVLSLVLVLALADLAAAAPASAENSPDVASAGGKKIKVRLGTLARVIDLSREIAGCTELYDPAEPGRRMHNPADIGVIDLSFKDRKYYVVLWAKANANCNVQGYCGAGENCTLVWIQLDERLKWEKKQAVVIQDCMAVTGVPDMDLEFPAEGLRLLAGRLELRFGDLVSEAPSWTRVLYERAACELGLRVMAPEAGE